MIYEHRVYEVAPGRMLDLHSRFREHTLKLFKRHKITPVVFFLPSIGELNDRLTYILSFDSYKQREEAWQNFLADPEWQKVFQESNASGPLVLRLKNKVFKATDYSPLK